MVALSRPARTVRPRPLLRSTTALFLLVLLGLTGLGGARGSIATSGAGPITGRAVEPAASLTVVIETTGPVVDPWVPFTLHAEVEGGIPPLEYLWQCPLLGLNRSANWTVSLGPGTNTTFTLEVADTASAWGSANTSISVAAPLRVSTTVPVGNTDSGVPMPLTVSVAGGVPPYLLQWALLGQPSTGAAPLPSAGNLTVPVTFNGTGSVWAEVTVLDAVNGTVTAVCHLPPVFPLPALAATAFPSDGEVGQAFSIQASVAGGAPPLEWSVEPLGPVANASAGEGVLDPSGIVSWTGVVDAEGNLSLVVRVVDSAGQTASLVLEVPVLAPVSSPLTTGTSAPANGSSLLMSAAVTGGLPPYRYVLVLSDGEGASGTLSSAGWMNWTGTPTRSGYLRATLTVTDALGYSSASSLTLLIEPGGIVPGPGSVPAAGTGDSLLAAVLSGVGVLGGVLVYRRWKRGGRPPPHRGESPGAPLGTLERLLSSPEGLDRESLEFLAEEEGVGPDRLNLLVDQAIRIGRVRTEEAPEGERLHWVPPRERPTEPRDTPGTAPSRGEEG